MRKNIAGLFIVVFFMAYSKFLVFAQDLIWVNIGKEIRDINVVLVDRANPKYIYIGTARGLFRTEDGGSFWRPVPGLNENINFLLQDNKSVIYLVTERGLFFSQDQGRNWKRIFRGRNFEKNDPRALAVLKNNKIYLGTDTGLLVSEDRGKTWARETGRLGNLPVSSIAEDLSNSILYVGTSNKAFKIDGRTGSHEEIFTLGIIDAGNSSEEERQDDADNSLATPRIKYLAVDPNYSARIYLATDAAIYVSEDKGISWNPISNFGLLSKGAKFILLSQDSTLYAINQSGVFVHKNERWQELSLRLPAIDIRFLSIDNQGNLYAATDKGIFKAMPNGSFIESDNLCAYFKDEPGIQELHEAAIKYAQVIDPKRIENLRRQARLKAVLPELGLDYNKTITTYSNSSETRFTVGPRDWGISLKWDLSDIIWSEQQRLIDSQARLAVGLRNDLLDEVNKIYFERRKVKIELVHLSPGEQNKIPAKKLRLEELTASLDALTGGYFSRRLKD